MALKHKTHEELKRSFTEGKSCDKDIFAEQRTNILLVAGDHYSKKKSKFLERVRNVQGLAEEQKLRLSKNHTYKIMRGYANAVTSFCPDVMPTPIDDKNLQDVKSAELHNKVKKYLSNKHRMKEKKRDWADDFTIIGEVGCKIFWDPTKGKQVAWEQKVDEDGNPVFEQDEEGNDIVDPMTGEKTPVQGDIPIFSGDLSYETFYGFNLIRERAATSMADSPVLHVQKMVDIVDMQLKYANDKEKFKMFVSSPDETMVVFDAQKGSYGSAQNQCMVVESYTRPSISCPNGYYQYWTENGIFEEGELPFGIWPIAFAPFDKYQTSPRGRSHIKILRPFQAEINRAASKMAEHQITLGDDKLISQAGSTLTQGSVLPGVRSYEVSGAPPTILPGRDGSQYAKYCSDQITEMYKASLVEEEMMEAPAQVDPYSLIFRAASQKKKFVPHTERFEQFLADVWLISLELSRHYMSDEELIQAIGVADQANIPEFKNPSYIGYQIKMEPQSEDLESKLGRQLTITQTLQYGAGKLEKEDIGKLLKNMPYGNLGETMKDFTLNYDLATNIILALDRGEYPQTRPSAPHQYLIQKLEARTNEGDFKFLPMNIQQAYDKKIQEHSQILAVQAAQLKAMEADFIPTGGAMITCDMYVPKPSETNPQASQRVRVPYEALNWLIERLANQGSTLGALEDMSTKNMIQIGQAAGIPGQQPQAGGLPPQHQKPMPMPMPRMPQPQGVS